MGGARNLHRLAGVLERRRREATTGTCTLCEAPSVGWIESWDLQCRGVCEAHAAQAVVYGYTVHRSADLDEHSTGAEELSTP